jgi:hypothetical protein
MRASQKKAHLQALTAQVTFPTTQAPFLGAQVAFRTAQEALKLSPSPAQSFFVIPCQVTTYEVPPRKITPALERRPNHIHPLANSSPPPAQSARSLNSANQQRRKTGVGEPMPVHFRYSTWLAAASGWLVCGCAVAPPRHQPSTPIARQPADPPPIVAAESKPSAEYRLVSHLQADQPGELLPATSPRPVEVRPLESSFPIDLPTALRLADADNLQVALAREQVQQAYAEYNGASALWLPSLRGGMHWNKHEGPLLRSSGEINDISRGSVYAGAGAQAVGGGSPAVPGVFANFNLADAYFQPLAAQQRWAVARNNALLDVANAYLELLRATQDIAIAVDVLEKVRELSRLTDAYAQTGQGLQADADRLRVELGLRNIDVRRSQEAQIVAFATVLCLDGMRLRGAGGAGAFESTGTPTESLPGWRGRAAPAARAVCAARSERAAGPELRQFWRRAGEHAGKL